MTLQGLTGHVARQLASVMLHFKGPTSEYGYKSGKREPRYVAEMVFPELPAGDVEDRAWTADDDAIEQSLLRSGERARRFPWFGGIEDEHVFLTIVDQDDLRLTIDVDGGEGRATRGWDRSRPPTATIPLRRQNILNLEALLGQDELGYDDLYRMAWILAPHAARAMYSIPLLREPGDKAWIGMDDFVQIEIPPPHDIIHEGRPIRIELTIVNVDGQWLVMDGLHGDPDARFTLTLEDAVQWYRFAVYDVRKATGTRELMDLARQVAAVTEKTMTYLRADHR
jgi:hypothetical protein